MTQLAAIPTLNVKVAFSPTNIQSPPSAQTFTDVSQYVREFDTKMGLQHFLDRIEAGTLRLTFDNRTGYFSQTGTILDTRLPIQVTATWGGTTYNVFYGLTETITERITDVLNVDLEVTASDLTKNLSLRYLQSPGFWQQYANVSSTAGWYRLGITSTALVTGASNPGSGTVTYQAVNNFVAGQTVSVTGLTIPSGSGYTSLNVTNATIASVGTRNSAGFSSYFTVSGFPSTVSASSGSGTAIINQIVEQISGTVTTGMNGLISFPGNGALIYDSNDCIDLTNGGTAPTGSVVIPQSTNGFDFWILGQSMQNSQITEISAVVGSTDYNFYLTVNSQGQLIPAYQPLGGSTTYVTPSTPFVVADGFWHHVGLILVGTTMYYYCDGVFGTLHTGVVTASVFSGGSIGSPAPGEYTLAAYVDEAVTLNNSANQTDVINRYVAGSLLQKSGLSTADMIAQVLTIAGFGSISSGAVSVPNYYVSTTYGSRSAWSPGTATSAYTEPYYWNTPVYTSTALDLILQISDTEVGHFYQCPDGSFQFNTRTYYGTWTWNSTTNTGTWATTYSTPSGNYVWTDNGTNIPYYGPSTEVVRDDADLWTSVRVDPQAGTSQIYENTANEPKYGYSTLVKTACVNSSLNSALSAASYLGYLFRTPLPRVNSVELQAETVVGGTIGYSVPAMLGTNFGDVVTFKRNPPGATGAGIINASMAVESVAHTFQAEPGTWHTTFILDPYPVRS